MAAHGVVEDEPEVLWGMEDGLIYGLVFDNVTIANETVENIDYFFHNEFVLNWETQTMITTGDKKWLKNFISHTWKLTWQLNGINI